MKVILMTREPAGKVVIDWIVQHYPEDIAAIVTDKYNSIFNTAISYDIPVFIFSTENDLISNLKKLNIQFDLGIMFWWTKLITKKLLSLPLNGFINTHPSLLPYNAGAMANVWTFIDDTPYGVTIHIVTEGIDDGPIIAQKMIDKTWEDNENTLYHKSIKSLQELFIDIYPNLRQGNFDSMPQDMSLRTFHTFKESATLGKILLESKYSVREFLNLLRSHTYEKYPGFWFEDDNKRYEVRISIKEIK